MLWISQQKWAFSCGYGPWDVLHLCRQPKSLHCTTQFSLRGGRSSKTWHGIKAAPHGSAEETSQGTEKCTKEFKPATLGKPEVITDRDNIQSTEFPKILMEKLEHLHRIKLRNVSRQMREIALLRRRFQHSSWKISMSFSGGTCLHCLSCASRSPERIAIAKCLFPVPQGPSKLSQATTLILFSTFLQRKKITLKKAKLKDEQYLGWGSTSASVLLERQQT